jgi:DNA-binding transcriptional regulator YhcF (GntR family)
MSDLSFRSSARNSDQAAWGRSAKADYRKTLERQRLAILCSDMDSTAKTVALVMLEHVNAAHYYATGELLVWPSIERLGALMQLSLATIKRARRALREEGVCEVRNDEGGRSETAEYVFLVEWRDRQAHAVADRLQQFEKNRLKSEPLSSSETGSDMSPFRRRRGPRKGAHL